MGSVGLVFGLAVGVGSTLAAGPAQAVPTGKLVICKESSTYAATTRGVATTESVDFTVSSSPPTVVAVPVNGTTTGPSGIGGVPHTKKYGCSPSTTLPRATYSVQEGALDSALTGWYLDACKTTPASRLVNCTDGAGGSGSATVKVKTGTTKLYICDVPATVATPTPCPTAPSGVSCDAAGSPTGTPQWTVKTPATSPPSRYEAEMACDAATGQLVLFGGINNTENNGSNDTWLWNGTTWAQVDDPGPSAGCGAPSDPCPSPTSPPPRMGASLSYDAATGDLVLFGGLDNNEHVLDDTWLWNGTTWTQVDDSPPGCGALGDACTGSVPPARYDFYSAPFPSAQGDVMVFGGYSYNEGNFFYDDTWVWDGSTDQWTQVDDGGNPGCGAPSDSCTGSPPARVGGRLTYDPAGAGAVVLFGGANGYELNDTWEWDGTSWTQVDDTGNPGCGASADPCPSPTSPPARYDPAAAYDPVSGDVVLFGGFVFTGMNTYLNDTWLWDGTTWTQTDDAGDPGCGGTPPSSACTGAPSARSYASVAYDGADALVLFAGANGNVPLDDTWVWSQ